MAPTRESYGWYRVGAGFSGLLTRAGLVTVGRNGRSVAQLRGEPTFDLLNLRLSAHGLEAQAAQITSAEGGADFRLLASTTRFQVDLALSDLVEIADGQLLASAAGQLFVLTLRAVATSLRSNLKPILSKGTVRLAPDERSTSVRAASAGLPSLGKRR